MTQPVQKDDEHSNQGKLIDAPLILATRYPEGPRRRRGSTVGSRYRGWPHTFPKEETSPPDTSRVILAGCATRVPHRAVSPGIERTTTVTDIGLTTCDPNALAA
jgi:hypothetical protein